MAVPAARAHATAFALARAGGAVRRSVTVAVLVVLAGLVVWPLATLVAASFAMPGSPTVAAYAAVARTPTLLTAIARSVGVAVVTALVTTALGTAIAYAAATSDVPGRRLAWTIARVPLVTPPFTAALGVVLLSLASGRMPPASSAALGMLVVSQILAFLPHVVVRVRATLSRIDREREEAAEILGASPITVARRVTLALARPDIVASALLVAALSLGDLANPLVVARDATVVTTAIYSRMVAGRDAATAAALAVVLSPPYAALIMTALRGGRRMLLPAPVDDPRPRRTAPSVRWPLAAICVAASATIVIVYGAVLLASIREWARDAATHEYWTVAVTNGSALLVTGVIAIGAAVAGTALAVVSAYLLERSRAATRGVAWLTGVPVAVPGVAIGVAYALAAGSLSRAGVLLAAVASVVAWTLGAAVAAVRDGLAAIDAATEDAAVSLGARGATVFRRIVVPMVAPRAASVALDLFAGSVLTVTTVIFLATPDVRPVSVAALTGAAERAYGVAAALAVGLSLVAGTARALRRAVAGAGPRVIVPA